MCSTGLTIPLQITLSEIRLSGFVILVFSKQKGITLVFRNDPLESLKASSTFDSIPFVRDYLQKEIEGQLRILFMDELPAIIHRLSLRLWVPEYRGQGEISVDKSLLEGPGLDPLLSPPQDPVDFSGNVLNSSEISSLSLDSAVEMHSLFSQKNLLRLAALTDSQRTLSLFTPSIQEVVFRAWTGSTGQCEDHSGLVSPISPALSRSHSHLSAAAHSFQDSSNLPANHSRPPLASSGFSGYGLSMGASRHSKTHPSRKRKKRVVDLRKSRLGDETESVSDGTSFTGTTSAPSVFLPSINPEDHNDDPVAPHRSPENTTMAPSMQEIFPEQNQRRDAPRRPVPQELRHDPTTRKVLLPNAVDGEANSPLKAEITTHEFAQAGPASAHLPEKIEVESSSSSPRLPVPNAMSFMDVAHNSSILEQAWMMKMAGEIARRIRDEKSAANDGSSFWDRHTREESPPPAYAQ